MIFRSSPKISPIATRYWLLAMRLARVRTPMPYQSPISPGISWYEDTAGPRPEYPRLDGDRRADVVIVGGGFTGLSAAAHLAKAGVNVALIDGNRFGDGASGRNGGQLGT